MRKCEGKEDREFVNFFLSNFKDLARWMEEIAVFERGEFDHTFYDEMLLHNPRDQFQSWLEKAGLAATVSMSQLDAALEQRSFQQMKKAEGAGIHGFDGRGAVDALAGGASLAKAGCALAGAQGGGGAVPGFAPSLCGMAKAKAEAPISHHAHECQQHSETRNDVGAGSRSRGSDSAFRRRHRRCLFAMLHDRPLPNPE